jgi:hypothetical protein
MNQFESSYGMTDRYAALSCLASMHGEASVEARRDTAMQKFYDEAEGDALILNKWFTGKVLLIVFLPCEVCIFSINTIDAFLSSVHSPSGGRFARCTTSSKVISRASRLHTL